MNTSLNSVVFNCSPNSDFSCAFNVFFNEAFNCGFKVFFSCAFRAVFCFALIGFCCFSCFFSFFCNWALILTFSLVFRFAFSSVLSSFFQLINNFSRVNNVCRRVFISIIWLLGRDNIAFIQIFCLVGLSIWFSIVSLIVIGVTRIGITIVWSARMPRISWIPRSATRAWPAIRRSATRAWTTRVARIWSGTAGASWISTRIWSWVPGIVVGIIIFDWNLLFLPILANSVEAVLNSFLRCCGIGINYPITIAMVTIAITLTDVSQRAIFNSALLPMMSCIVAPFSAPDVLTST